MAVNAKVAGVRQHPAGFDQAVYLVFVGFVFCCVAGLAQGFGHRRCGPAALAGVGLVDDDCKSPAALLAADLVEDERELLDRRDDDLLALLDESDAGRQI